MSSKDKTCTISGMRPFKLPNNIDFSKLLGRLDDEIYKSVFHGYFTYQIGMAMGIDLYAAEIVLKLKHECPAVRLVCYQPYETQASDWPNVWREKYYDILAGADGVICSQKYYCAGCIKHSNRNMIDNSSRMIAVYNEKPGIKAAQTINYAKKRGLSIVIINPLDCLNDLP